MEIELLQCIWVLDGALQRWGYKNVRFASANGVERARGKRRRRGVQCARTCSFKHLTVSVENTPQCSRKVNAAVSKRRSCRSGLRGCVSWLAAAASLIAMDGSPDSTDAPHPRTADTIAAGAPERGVRQCRRTQRLGAEAAGLVPHKKEYAVVEVETRRLRRASIMCAAAFDQVPRGRPSGCGCGARRQVRYYAVPQCMEARSPG